MKKLIIGVAGMALLMGCRSGGGAMMPVATARGPAMPTGSVTGAATPRDAVVAFMAAIKAEDLQALGGIWGTKNGPARDAMSTDVLQKRELTMLCFLHFDSYRIVAEAPAMHDERTYAVELKYQKLEHTGQFDVGRASDDRYYVFSVVNFDEFKDFCAASNGGS